MADNKVCTLEEFFKTVKQGDIASLEQLNYLEDYFTETLKDSDINKDEAVAVFLTEKFGLFAADLKSKNIEHAEKNLANNLNLHPAAKRH